VLKPSNSIVEGEEDDFSNYELYGMPADHRFPALFYWLEPGKRANEVGEKIPHPKV
jgi:hypothetical protein